MNGKTLMAMALTATVIMSTGCISDLSGNTFSRDETRSAASVAYGTVIEVREGKIEGTKSGVGAIAGGALGAIAASEIGGGTGKALATVGGGLLGAGAGAAAEEAVTSQKGLEITVRLDSGREIMVVQAADVLFAAGQRVRVVTLGNGSSRVQPAQ